MDEVPEGPSTDHLEQVIEQHREEIHRIPGVVGTAVGYRTEQEEDLALILYYRSPGEPVDIRRRVQAIIPDEPIELRASPGFDPL